MKTRFALATMALGATPALAQSFNEPPDAVDINPDPNIVEVNLTASVIQWQYTDGVDTTTWAYNGSVPGPIIRADVGQTIRVNFTNNLPEETTVHWHGVDAPAHVDGSHISQNPIPPGGSHVYEWTALNAGFHWYHPHVRTNDQLEKGLQGGILIRDPLEETQLGLHVIEEHILFFDDILLDSNGQVVPAFSFSDPLQNAVYQLNGREGNLLLINGKDASQAELTVPNGQPQRWRIVNSANTTFARLDLRDATEGIDQSVWQLGTDQGFINKPFRLLDLSSTAPGAEHPTQALLSQMGEGIFLMPGERMDIVFTPIGTDGEEFTVYQNDWYRGRHTAHYNSAGMIMMGIDPMDGLYPKQQLLKLKLQGNDPGRGEYTPPALLRDFPDWSIPSKGTLPLMMGHGMPDMMGNVMFFVQMHMVNGQMMMLPGMQVTSEKAMDVEIGDVWTWQVTNMTHGEHPFHMHGFKFELIEYEFQDDVEPTNNFLFTPQLKRQYKDTIRIPPRLGAKGTSRTIARLRVHFDDTGRESDGGVVAMGERATYAPDGSWTSGGWLAHCHLLEHAARGMATFFEVHDPNEVFTLHGKFLPGTNGNASLTAEGDVPGGAPVPLTVMNAKPGSTVFLIGGNVNVGANVLGGTLVPGFSSTWTTPQPGDPLYGLILSAKANFKGKAVFNINGWQGAPSGGELYFQAAFKDAGAVKNWALTNAVSFTRP